PQLLGDPDLPTTSAINGLLSLTPDGAPLVGPTPEVQGLWSAAAVWIKEGAGVGRMLAEWITHGTTEIDPHAIDVARFYSYARSSAYVHDRAAEGFPKIYGIVHPREQWLSRRPIRTSPFYPREQELGASFFEAGGWERPQWYESNNELLETYAGPNAQADRNADAGRIPAREAEWDARWWSPLIEAEHLAMRETAAMIDLSAFAVFDVTGPGALDYLQQM